MNYLLAFTLLTIAGDAFSQVPFPGACPKVETVTKFDLQKYLGKWYQHSAYPAFFELNAKCVQGEYGLNSDGTIDVANSGTSTITGIKTTTKAVGYADDLPRGKLLVKFASSPVNGTYWVLGTDYENYSVVWSCRNSSLSNIQFAWILTRKRVLDKLEILDGAYDVYDRNNISRNALVVTDQQNCQ